jgi:hypothetical protein
MLPSNIINQQLQLLASQIAHLQGGTGIKVTQVSIAPPPVREFKGEPVAPPALDQEPDITRKKWWR